MTTRLFICDGKLPFDLFQFVDGILFSLKIIYCQDIINRAMLPSHDEMFDVICVRNAKNLNVLIMKENYGK